MNNRVQTRTSTLKRVMEGIDKQQWRVKQLLPPDLPFERFHGNVFNALRSNAAVLDAQPNSIIEACMKAAYDGLRIDGREAAIVTHETTFDRNTDKERKVTLATYFPMAFGLIQQCYRGGEVVSMYADVIKENDFYDVQRGTNPGILHKPLLTGERGEIIAAYSVATLASGAVTFELLDRKDLTDIRGAAKAQNVWKSWPGEMSKKSAIRRHRKTLPIGERDIIIRDSEETDLFVDDKDQPQQLPAAAGQTAAPTRQQIAAQINTEAGADMDVDEGTGEVIEQQEQKPAKKREQKQARQDDPTEQLPEDEDAWRAWSASVQDEIAKAPSSDAVNEIAKREEKRLTAASKDRADFIRDLISDRLTDFLTGEGDD